MASEPPAYLDAFHGNYIAAMVEYDCEREDVAPPFRWRNTLSTRRSGAVMCLAHDARHSTKDVDALELDHLRVMVARPEYLLAMKCVALRIARFYSAERFPQTALYALAELLQGRA